MNEPLITLVGNLTDDPELRFIPSGAAVANFTVASTPRVKSGDQWVDGEAMFVRCAAWRELSENIVESLTKGTRVIVQGRLSVRSWESKDGKKGTSLELDVEAIGPELRFATSKVNKVSRGGGGGGQQQGRQQPRSQQSDPWATPSLQGGQDPWGQPANNEPAPF